MTLQFHSWAYNHRKTWSERIHAPQCSRKRPECPLIGEWTKKTWDISTMGYHSAFKKNEIMPFAATWMDLESPSCILLSEVSQTDKEISNDIPCMWNLNRNATNELTSVRQRLTGSKNKLTVASGERQLRTLGRSCTHGYI